MKKQTATTKDDELRKEYHLSALKGGVRGKYLKQKHAGTNIALLNPDVRAAFPTAAAGRNQMVVRASRLHRTGKTPAPPNFARRAQLRTWKNLPTRW